MKDELNNYNINNPDGKSADGLDGERRISFSNDKPGSVPENSSRQIDEWDRSAPEDSSTSSEGSEIQSSESGSNDFDSGSGETTDPSSSSAAADASSASASSATVGSSVGTLVGVAATVAVAAVVIVVTFISTMIINVSLSMAEMTRLIFQVEIKQAQEEDFANPIYAVLEGDDGYQAQQEIHPNTVFLTFEDLQPGKEYFLKIYNEEKVFFKKSYVTATENVDHAFLDVNMVNDDVTIHVHDVSLNPGEFYTLTVKDAEGNVVFVKDSVDVNAEYRITLQEAKDLYYTITVNGAIYAVDETLANSEPKYDLENGTWAWVGDTFATITFADQKGGTPLVLQAVITSETVAEPTCETAGSKKIIAAVEYEGRKFTDEKTGVLPAINHAYAFDSFVWSDDYTAQAKYVCEHDDTHVVLYDATVTSAVTTEPTCEGTGIRTYTATYEGNTASVEEVLAAIEHAYVFDSFVWSDDYTAQAKYVCEHDDTHVTFYDATVTSAVTTEPTCEGTGIRTYTATYEENTASVEEVLAAINHAYVFDSFVWNDDYTAQAKYVCEHDDTHVTFYDATVTSAVTTEPTCEGTGIRTYTATYEENTVSVEEVLAAINHAYVFDSFVWSDDYTAQAKYVCEHDDTHIVYYNATVTSEVTTEPTFEETGIRTYTATYEGYTDSIEEVLAVIEPEYVFDSFVWSTTYTAQAKYVCRSDETLVEYYDAVVTSEVTTEATCEGKGVKTHTATYEGHTETKRETIAAIGHKWKFDSYVMDGNTQMAKYVCEHDSSHVIYREVNNSTGG